MSIESIVLSLVGLIVSAVMTCIGFLLRSLYLDDKKEKEKSNNVLEKLASAISSLERNFAVQNVKLETGTKEFEKIGLHQKIQDDKIEYNRIDTDKKIISLDKRISLVEGGLNGKFTRN